MTDEEIEEEIRYLDRISADYCINPKNQTDTCCDCYLCRVAEFEKIRGILRRGGHVRAVYAPIEGG